MTKTILCKCDNSTIFPRCNKNPQYCLRIGKNEGSEMSDVRLINNLFSKEQLESINRAIDNSCKNIPIDANSDDKNNDGNGVNSHLGRFQITNFIGGLTEDFFKYIHNVANNFFSNDLILHHALYVEYNNNFGQPNLPPHYDHDVCDLIINYQLSSNTQWDIGLDKKLYSLEDNSALIFNGNYYPHWRPHKEFKDGEYVKMLFFRFYNKKNPSDYDHLDHSLDDPIWTEISKFRDTVSGRGSRE